VALVLFSVQSSPNNGACLCKLSDKRLIVNNALDAIALAVPYFSK